MSSPPPPPAAQQPSKPLLSRSLLLAVAAVAVAGLGITGVSAHLRQEPVAEKIEVTDRVPIQSMQTVIKDVETEDGRTVRAKIEVPVFMTKEAKHYVDATRELTPQQKTQLSMYIGAAGLVGFFLLVNICIYAKHHFKGETVPKSVEDWLNRLAGTALGMMLTFVGNPAPEGQLKPKDDAKAPVPVVAPGPDRTAPVAMPPKQ